MHSIEDVYELLCGNCARLAAKLFDLAGWPICMAYDFTNIPTDVWIGVLQDTHVLTLPGLPVHAFNADFAGRFVDAHSMHDGSFEDFMSRRPFACANPKMLYAIDRELLRGMFPATYQAHRLDNLVDKVARAIMVMVRSGKRFDQVSLLEAVNTDCING